MYKPIPDKKGQRSDPQSIHTAEGVMLTSSRVQS